MSAITSQTAWNAVAQAILDQATSGAFSPKDSTFSLAGQTLSVDLADADPTISAASIFGLGDTIPAAGGAYVAKSSLIGSYFSLLNWIQLKTEVNANIQSQINIAAAALTAAQTNYQDQQTKAIAAWTAFKQISPLSFPDFVRTQFQTYGAAKDALDAATSKYSSLMVQAYGADYQTIVAAQGKAGFNGAQSILQNSLNMPVKFGNSAPAGSGPAVLPGQTPPAAASSLISTFAPGYTLDSAFTTKYQEWQALSVTDAPTGLKIHVDASNSATDWTNFGWSAGAQADFPVMDFVSVQVEGQASYASQKFDYSSSDFSLDIEYLGSGLFPIRSNLWFDPSICINYGGSLRKGAPDFFNEETGSLARYPSQVLIGFCPKITMKLSAADYSSFKSQFQQSATVAVKVGPFTVGHASESSYCDKSSVAFNDSNSSFTIGPVSTTVPMVIAVISSKIIPSA